MIFGEKILKEGSSGLDVIELQIRLSGFRGTTWDGIFKAGTKKQVEVFQEDYMQMDESTGIVDENTFAHILKFSEEFKLDFEQLRCRCGQCEGFGQQRFKNEYRKNIKRERYHRYEYPGIHKAILHAYKAAMFYVKKAGLSKIGLTSGYRCHVNNTQKGRSSTNHMGKALDFDFTGLTPRSKADKESCNRARGMLVEKGHFQINWGASNRKALEPSNIAPSWVHMDVRKYDAKYLADKYFVKSAEELYTLELE